MKVDIFTKSEKRENFSGSQKEKNQKNSKVRKKKDEDGCFHQVKKKIRKILGIRKREIKSQKKKIEKRFKKSEITWKNSPNQEKKMNRE